MATTVTGTIKTADGSTFTGTITFSPHPRIKIIGGVSVLGSVVTESVSGGSLNLTLEAGNYYVEAPGTKPFRITVPASGTVDISTIIVSGAGNVAVAEVGIPSGGTTGQVLTKSSGDDYDADWEDSAGGGVEEAPEDDTPYARQNAGWVALSGGGDMLAATYDTNSDGKVNAADAADSVPDTGVAFTDNTTGNASTSAHGFAPKMAAPAAGLLNVLGTANGDIAPEAKGLFDTTAPAALGTASSGTSVLAARRDHVHQMPKLDDVAAPDDNTDLNASTSAHGLAPKASAPASGFLNVLGIANGETAFSNKGLYNDSTTPAADGVAATGTSVYAARRDHVHPAAEGTAIKSTGETGGTKFLREDGDGTSSWQTAPSDATSIRGVAIDSTVGSPSDGSILVYRTAGSDWVLEAKPAAGSNPAIADITDWPAGVDATEVGYLNGVTSAIQTQLGDKAPLISPSFTTPTIGVASATSVNKVAITAPATAATLTLSDGSSLITSGGHSITLTSSGATNVTLPTSGTLATTAQLHDAATVTGNGIGISGQQISLNIGTGATDVAAGNHTHSGVYSLTGAVGSSGLTMTTARLLGRTTASTGAVEEVAVGNGLTLASTNLELKDIVLLGFALSDETTALTTGEKVSIRVPAACRVRRVYASVKTAPVDATLEIDVEVGGTSILNAVIGIASTNTSAETSTFASSATYYDLAKGDLLTIDIDQTGSTTKGAGAKVTLHGTFT